MSFWSNLKDLYFNMFDRVHHGRKEAASTFTNGLDQKIDSGIATAKAMIGHGATFDTSTMSSGSGSGSGSAQGAANGAPVSNAPSVNSLSLNTAPITSAVSGIQDPELRANAFNEMMADSAHQREVKDLLAAGLNPVLSTKYGGAASSAYELAQQTSSGGSSGGSAAAANSFLGLPMINRPTKPWHIAYNLVVANGDKILGISRNAAQQFGNAYENAMRIGREMTQTSASSTYGKY